MGPIKSVGLRHLPASLKGNSPIILCKLLMIALRLTRQRKYPLCSTRFVKRNWRNKASCFCLKKKKEKKKIHKQNCTLGIKYFHYSLELFVYNFPCSCTLHGIF